MLNKRFVSDIVACLIILLFMYAALSKLAEFEKFQIELSKSPILGFAFESVSWAVPSTEILISILLSVKRWQYTAFYAAFTLIVAFSAYIVFIITSSEYIPCSCGGIIDELTWTQHLFVNFGFMVLSATGVLIGKQHTDSLRNIRGSRKPS